MDCDIKAEFIKGEYMNAKMSLATLMCATLLGACAQKADKTDDLKDNPKGTITEMSEAEIGNWFTRDPGEDGEEGVSSDLAIAELDLPETKTVIVAVIDSGVDYEHEDLKDVMWVNPGESGMDEAGNDKATNGIDDDGNGYIDDIHGWNYIGGKDGSHITKETLEMTREVVRYKKRIADGDTLTEEELNYFEKVKSAVAEEKDYATSRQKKYGPIHDKIEKNITFLKDTLGIDELTVDILKNIDSTDSKVKEAQQYLLDIVNKYGSLGRIKRAMDYFSDILKYYTNEDFDPRSTIVGDDPSDFEDKDYGNNDVKGPDAGHGTHVAGIIGAIRGNGKGIDGVATDVKIMALRAVPDGDERDKDIALAVRYAADNGAKIINMSFGKAFSPFKHKVDEAFMYAASKGVLIMNAAGNDSNDIDKVDSFPNKKIKHSGFAESEIPGFITVGASSRIKNLMLPANFSNYGKKYVDFFAPGHKIHSAIPENKYATYSGTSMACPAAAGVAALVWSHFPELSALQLKDILKHTTRKYEGYEVRLPGAEQYDLPVMFSKLSETGGIVDAKAALVFTKFLSEN